MVSGVDLPSSQAHINTTSVTSISSVSPYVNDRATAQVDVSAEAHVALIETLSPSLPDSAPASFTPAGKLVTQLMQLPIEQTTVAASKAPLLNSPELNTPVLAKTLQSALSSSGLFYESHLHQWAEGKLGLDQLQKEPQASLTIPDTTTNTLTMPLPKEALPLIQHQLHALEQHQITWCGELWPGLPLEWHVSRDPAQHHQHEAVEKTWQSTVRFELPLLGTVSAHLQLTGEHLQLKMQAVDTQTTQLLQHKLTELASALEGTGVKCDSLLIKTTQ